jgi:hypothetical protein
LLLSLQNGVATLRQLDASGRIQHGYASTRSCCFESQDCNVPLGTGTCLRCGSI